MIPDIFSIDYFIVDKIFVECNEKVLQIVCGRLQFYKSKKFSLRTS